MRPAYKFPRSQASLDLSEANRAAEMAAGPSTSVSHPAFLVTDSQGEASHLDDEQHFADAPRSSLAPLAPSRSAPNPAHLSASLFPSKSLSRISEYSESVYSSAAYSRDSQDCAESPSLSYLYSPPGGRDSSASTSAFPAPPASAHLAPAASSPTPFLATNPIAPSPVPTALRAVTPDERQPEPGLLSAPRKHHLPSRPLTTPFPSEGLAPMPVPLDNFAAPPGRERAEAAWNGHAMTGSEGSEGGWHASSAPEHFMVQVPGQALVAQDQGRRFSHLPGGSQSTTKTGWTSTHDGFDAQFDSQSVLYNEADAYDTVPTYGSPDLYGEYPERNASANRFTLDDDEKVRRRRKGSDASAQTNGNQGWDPEREKRGSNKWIWWGLLALLLVGAGVGLGVGLSRSNFSSAHAGSQQNAAAAAAANSESSSVAATPSMSMPTMLYPSSASTAFASSAESSSIPAPASVASSASVSPSPTESAAGFFRPDPYTASATATDSATTSIETFSTTFGFSRHGGTTVVPLTYTIPTSFDTRANGQWQFTESVVLPEVNGPGSFTSDLRIRVRPTTSPAAASATATAAARSTAGAQRRSVDAPEAGEHWKRHRRSRLIR
ncbi:hypothetical protein JCM8202_001760 [Rhodotorula sphaerocarpa]